MPKRTHTSRNAQALRMLRLGLGAVQSFSIAQLIAQAAARYGLDPSLLMAMAQRESGLNPNIVNAATGASGVMQLLPATARSLGVTDIFDAAQNIDAGARYLAQLIRQFGDVVKGVAAYDWGPGRLSSAIAQWGGDWLRHAPGETIAYIRDVLGVTPDANAPSPAPLTIDATTGLPVEDSTDVATLAPANGTSSLPAPGQLLLLTALGWGVYLVADLMRE